ncbi:MAG: GYF domain-containing protein [Candidatus Azobacteroides sp.]|nr:GYF domain-containing protein [Candidatus Azobacteroides sp.]
MEENYYYQDAYNQQQGPVTKEELTRLRIDRNTQVWMPGMDNWQPAGTIAGLEGIFPPSLPGAAKIETTFHPNGAEEIIIYKGPANHYVNIEARGGTLYLTTKRLRFLPHALNIQQQEFEASLNEIREVGFRNSLGIVPNGLTITLDNGRVEKFVVSKRKIWKEEIEKLIQ